MKKQTTDNTTDDSVKWSKQEKIDFKWMRDTIINLTSEIEDIKKWASIGKSLTQEVYSEEDVMKILGIKERKTLHNLTYKGVLKFQDQEGRRGKYMTRENLKDAVYGMTDSSNAKK